VIPGEQPLANRKGRLSRESRLFAFRAPTVGGAGNGLNLFRLQSPGSRCRLEAGSEATAQALGDTLPGSAANLGDDRLTGDSEPGWQAVFEITGT
jgi:hypothetical protein